MTDVFSWENSVSLCPASFCTPRASLPVTLGISWLPTFVFQSPLMKRTSFFLVLVLEGLVVLIEPFSFSFFNLSGWALDLDYCDVALEMNRDHSVVFEIAPKYCLSDSFVDYEDYSISSKGFLPTMSELNSPILVRFILLIPKMSVFTLAIFYLITSNLPQFISGSYAILFFTASDFTSITSHTTAVHCFPFGSASSFFLELFLHSSPGAIEYLPAWWVSSYKMSKFWGSKAQYATVVSNTVLYTSKLLGE